MNNDSRGSFNESALHYDSWYDQNRAAYYSELAAIKKVIGPGGRTLEIGVGTGRFAAPLGIKIGIDPAREMLRIARQRGCEVIQAVGECLPFADGVFASVFLITALCFIKQPERLIEEIGRVLKQGGNVIIGMLDKESFLGRWYEERKKESAFYGNARFFSVPEVLRLLGKKKWGDIDIIQTLYDPPENIRGIQPVRKGYGRGAFVVITAVNSDE